MKPNKLVQIKNVVRADACIQFLMNRPKTEMVGLGLIYGKPGLGKTTYASRIAFMRGYIYMRLESTTTPKSFAVDLMTALYRRFGLGEFIPSGITNNIFKYCLKLLDDNPETVIVIDEIDYAFKHDKLLGAIRDIVDVTLTIVILVGMQDVHILLKKATLSDQVEPVLSDLLSHSMFLLRATWLISIVCR
ncbi:MAG TPA: ATP-binding protein [Candidatus Cloacimonadota bacterium]|nr:ATP-binding protein [Candidatus Cloacimonadota bacterium]